MRLIDADELQIVSIDDPTDWDKDNKFCYVPKQYVEDAPTVDAEPVVRCKDCIHYDEGYCTEQLGMSTDDGEAFCSWGERRQNE